MRVLYVRKRSFGQLPDKISVTPCEFRLDLSRGIFKNSAALKSMILKCHVSAASTRRPSVVQARPGRSLGGTRRSLGAPGDWRGHAGPGNAAGLLVVRTVPLAVSGTMLLHNPNILIHTNATAFK